MCSLLQRSLYRTTYSAIVHFTKVYLVIVHLAVDDLASVSPISFHSTAVMPRSGATYLPVCVYIYGPICHYYLWPCATLIYVCSVVLFAKEVGTPHTRMWRVVRLVGS